MIWFTADWHLNETRIFDNFNPFFRPFDSIKEQNERIINEINRFVGKNDQLIHLGDVCMDLEAVQLLDRIKCKNRTLILGNYDVDDSEKQALLSEKFDVVKEEDYFKLSNGEIVYLNHYPSKAQDGYFNIVGHIHGLWKVQPNIVNVGVDAWHFRPVSEKQIFFIKNAIQNHYDENVFPLNSHLSDTFN